MTPQMSEPAPYICYACANGRHSDCQEEACKCSHRAQPSHPAAQSETPEIDAQFNECAAMGGKWDRLADLARSLERRLSLAQTEIKGHMRNEGDLLNELALARADWACAQARIAELEKDNKLWHANWEAAHAEVQEARDFIVEQSKGNLGGGERPVEFLLASYKLMAHERAQAEKDAARYRFLTEPHNDWHVARWTATPRGSGTWKSIHGATLTEAIDAALQGKIDK